MWRGHRRSRAATTLTPSRGDTRFAPLSDTRHAYVSASLTAALLESCLHELHPPDPVIYIAQLAGWSLTPLRLRHGTRFADLRDPQLARLGIPRTALVNTSAAHYACTRRWASALQGRKVGGYAITGALWNSRQADLHAAAHPGGLAADLLTHRAVEVGVVWSPPAPSRPFQVAGPSLELVTEGHPARVIHELAALLHAPVL